MSVFVVALLAINAWAIIDTRHRIDDARHQIDLATRREQSDVRSLQGGINQADSFGRETAATAVELKKRMDAAAKIVCELAKNSGQLPAGITC